MKTTFYTLLLTGVALLPLTAHAANQIIQTTVTQTASEQNLTTPELNAIKQGALTNNGQPIPVETQFMMSTGNLDGYTIGKIQQSLFEKGHYKGQITGTWDAQTTAALQTFQHANGGQIDETGKMIGSGTLARLGVTMDKLTAGDDARLPDVHSRTVATSSTTNTRISGNTDSAFNPYHSPTVKSLGTVEMAASSDVPVGTHVSKSRISQPGKTVPAPDNGSKSTLTRDAIASGQFNETIDGSVARGTTDATPPQNATTESNPNAGIAGTPSASPTRSTPVNSSNTVVGNSNLRAGDTSSATITTTGSLRGTSTPQGAGNLSGEGTAANNVDGRAGAGSPATTSSAVGDRASGSLSNSSTTAATGSGIAASGGALSDGSSTASSGSSLSGSSSLSSGSSSGSSGGSGGGF